MPHILVGGAGIGGLTAAVALARHGGRVTLLERRPALAEFGAGLQLAPNATRVLARLGLLETIRAKATEPETVRIRQARDGTDLVRMPLSGAAEKFGAPFLLVHRADLQRILAEAAEALGRVELRLGAEVAAHAVDPDGVSVMLARGAAPLRGDGFVDAAGVHADRAAAPALPAARFTAWRALVPSDALPPALRAPDTNLWLGSGAHLVHYPLRGGSTVNAVAITPRVGATDSAGDDHWSQAGDPALLRRHFRGWHRDACVLLDSAVEWRCWPLFDAAPLRRWSDGPTTRLGDAAHPMLPFLAQGASQAIEDAGALADAISATAGVSAAFRRYERLRAPRAARVQQASRRQGDLYHLGRPASDARDLVMRTLGGARALARMGWLYASA